VDSPIVAAVLKAFDGIVRSIQDSSPNATFEWARSGRLRQLFIDDLSPLTAAIKAEELSRKIAIEELRRALDEGLNDFDHDREVNMSLEMSKDQFFALVDKWLERVKS